MKLRHLFLAAIVALGMMACSNEDVPQPVDGAEATVSVKVVPTSNGAGVRAVGDLSGAATSAIAITESAIKKLEVYLFFGDKVEGYGSADNAYEVKDITTKTGPKTIVVVANGNIGTVADKPELLARTKNLPVTIANGLTMTGMTVKDVVMAPGQNYYGYVTGQTPSGKEHSVGSPLLISRVNARVAIVSAKLELDNNSIFDKLQDVEVAMFNVKEEANLFNPNTTSGKWLYGQKWLQTEGTYEDDPTTSAASAAFFEGATTAFSMPIGITNAPYFYVNPLETVNKMFIVLRGKAFKGTTAVIAEGLYTDAAGYTYFPVWVNGKDLGYAYTGDNTNTGKVLRNTQYNIYLTIKKIGNPTIDPVAEAYLDVKVEVEPWAVVKQDVTWN